MTLTEQMKRQIKGAVDQVVAKGRDQLRDEVDISSEDSHAIAFAAMVMIENCPGVTFGPTSAAFVAGVVLSALNYAEQQRRRKVQ
jgi:hypothetical protein